MSFRIYQNLAIPILRQTALPMVFCYAALAFFFSFVLPGILTTNQPNNTTAQVVEVIIMVGVALFVALPLLVYGLGSSIALTTQLASRYIMGEIFSGEPAISHTHEIGFKTLPLLGRMFFQTCGLLLVSALLLFASGAVNNMAGQELAVAAAVALLAIVGVVVGLIAIPFVLSKLCLAPSVLANEGVSAKEAVKRSTFLMKSHPWQPAPGSTVINSWFVCLLVFLILWGALSAIFGIVAALPTVAEFLTRAPASSGILGLVQGLPVYLALWLTTPLYCCSMSILYFDRRVRLEAFDISVLRKDVLDAKRR